MTGLTLKGVEKSYGATRALRAMDLLLPAGLIIGIAGPNGAGKSTLTRVLAGEEQSDAGRFELDGAEWDPHRQGKVAVVHQEPQVWPNLTVGENLRVGREGSSFLLTRPSEREHSVLRELQLEDLRHRPLESCSLAVQQRVEIARAMLADAQCFIFDEPNSALTDEDSSALFEFMHQLAATGHIVLLISHRLGELAEHCSQVVIVRDGRAAQILSGDELTERAIAAELVVGATDTDDARPRSPREAEVASRARVEGSDVVTVTQWSSAIGAFRDVSLAFHSGSVTAVMGAEGSGAREFLASLAGFEPAQGERSVRRDPQTTGSDVVTYLPPDRKAMLFHNLTVGDNLVARLRQPQIANQFGTLRKDKIRQLASDAIAGFGIKTHGASQPISALSGGNQQKVAIVAALVSQPAALIVIEPTRGVDISSKRGIYATLREASLGGLAVIIFCTEVPETFEAADRFVVIDRGTVVMDEQVDKYEDVTQLAIAIASTTGTDAVVTDDQMKGNK